MSKHETTETPTKERKPLTPQSAFKRISSILEKLTAEERARVKAAIDALGEW